MCTLTYFLTDNGYELFFNRDEQRARSAAIPPKINTHNTAIYPVDPQGNGTWLAVNNQGVSLALLNYYHAKKYAQNTTEPKLNDVKNVSRGQLILSLIKNNNDIKKQLGNIDLTVYQPFQLCIFPKNLSLKNEQVVSIKWDGGKLFEEETTLPITSSSVDFEEVKAMRVLKYKNIVNEEIANAEQLTTFHYSQENEGKYSVNMQRPDAMTVSVSHIIVDDTISFIYHDNVNHERINTEFNRQTDQT